MVAGGLRCAVAVVDATRLSHQLVGEKCVGFNDVLGTADVSGQAIPSLPTRPCFSYFLTLLSSLSIYLYFARVPGAAFTLLWSGFCLLGCA